MKNIVPLTLSLAMLLGGCATSGEIKAPAETAPQPIKPLDLIARDFAGALRQLQSLPPADTTVSMRQADSGDAFTQAMLDALQQVGYGIRWVNTEGSVSLFQYRVAQSDAAAAARHKTYELAVGSVEMRRDYLSDGQRVQPLTPLYVRGADASSIVPHDDIFAQSALRLPAAASPLDPVINRGVSRTLPSLNTARSLSVADLPQVENVFELGLSNFADTLADRTVVARQILVFGNDSLRLGDHNKKLVEQMVQRFNPQSDVFSVIGCSMGPTRIAGGNAALALGRAGRVVEALRFAGVDDGRILDEGCWAGGGELDDLPSRGVVLTLNRR
ncbi:MAG: hypothetical protein AB8B97_22605 [Granulosicoccus sp.]